MKKIMYTIFIILCYSILATPVLAENILRFHKNNYDKKWKDCKIPNDCIKAEGICFRADAVNKNYLTSYARYVDYEMAARKCVLPSEAKKASDLIKIATCKENQCVIENPKEIE
jgi:hypothetical protein